MYCLIVKTSSLGDILQTFPAASYLKSKGYKLDWVCEKRFAHLVESNPDIDRVITIDSKRWPRGLKFPKKQYDLLIDFQGNCKSGLVTFLCKAKRKIGFSFATCAEWPNSLVTNERYPLDLSNPYLTLAQNALHDTQSPTPKPVSLDREETVPTFSGEWLMICPGSAWRNKQLPVATWRALLKDVPHKLLIIWGSVQEKKIAEDIARGHEAKIMGRLPFGVWQGMMEQMAGVVGVDSSSIHLCALTLTPSFSIFGPTSPNVYQPKGPQHDHFWGTCPYDVYFAKRCPRMRTCPTGACTHALDIDALKTKFDHWLIEHR